MKIYVSNIEESYKDTIMSNLVISDTEYLLVHILKCWRACAVEEDKHS